MTDVPQIVPMSGVMGVPSGVKTAGKTVDFKLKDFDLLIESKGYRIAWSRMAQCPCDPSNSDTRQPDPNCSLCDGAGFMYFGPELSVGETVTGDLDDLQNHIIGINGSSVIRGLMTRFEQGQKPYTPATSWVDGEAFLTVRSPNKLGWLDKLVNLDAVMPFSEIVTVPASGDMSLRYPARGVNLLRSVDTVYTLGTDFGTTAEGKIQWLTSPAPNTRVVAHYLMHPQWIVTSHPHVIRSTLSASKTLARPLKTPTGTESELPIQTRVQLDFLM